MFEDSWSDKEIKDLFNTMERVKNEGKSLKQGFLSHAQKYMRRPNSVRNYYYKKVDELIKNEKLAKYLKIDLKKHKKQEVKFFSESEGEKIISEIDKLVSCGNSVRQACLKLSGGNVALMLRYQNKYRNQNARKDETVPQPINILEYQNKQKFLNDNDINSLFMGLVKLIKKNAYDQADQDLKRERNSLSFLLKKTLIDLNKKENENNELKKVLENYENENRDLREKLTYKSKKKENLVCKLTNLKAEVMKDSI